MTSKKKQFFYGRPTIGIMIDIGNGPYSNQIIKNITNKAKDLAVNILFFAGNQLNSPITYNMQENIIYQMIDKEKLDGLIISGTLDNYIGVKAMQIYLERFTPLPIVSISSQFKGIPSVITDNTRGLEILIDHLIKIHGYKNIAFIKGPSKNKDALERFTAYKNTLKKAGILYRKNLVEDGEFWTEPAYQAIEKIYNQNQGKIDAVVCANDEMALGVLQFVKQKNLKVPNDFALTGFDNIEDCLSTDPPLSTVYQPINEMSAKALENIIDLIENKPVPLQTIIKTAPVIRKSCGCKINLTSNMENEIKKQPSKSINIKKLDNIFLKIKKLLPSENKSEQLLSIIQTILNYFEHDYSQKKPSQYFIQELSQFLDLLIEQPEKIKKAERSLQILSKEILATINDQTMYQVYANLFSQARFIIQEQSTQFLINDQVKKRALSNAINIFRYDSMESQDFSALGKVMIQYLPQFKINSFYLCLYKNTYIHKKDDSWHLPEESKLIAVCENGKEKHPEEVYFSTTEIIPKKYKLFDTPGNLLLLPLNNGCDHYGYILLQTQPEMSKDIFNLKYQISSVIKSIFLIQAISQLDKLKNDFIANITHDFRSPLTIILNIADLALHGTINLPKEIKDDFRIISQAGLRLKKSIDRLLDLAKMDARGVRLRIEEVDLTVLLSSIVSFYASSLSTTGIIITKDFPIKKIENFYTDIEKLEEVLNNIISNAIKFVDSQNGQIHMSLVDCEEFVIIKITDNGIGIPTKKIDSIFNRFEQAHSNQNSRYSGTGIGLAFSKQLLGYLKGKIWAKSKGKDQGSSFLIELKKSKDIFKKEDFVKEKRKIIFQPDDPLAIITKNKKDLDENTLLILCNDLNEKGEYNHKKAKILIVDDEKIIRNIILKYLSNAGYKNFILASDGAMALNAVYEHIPDLIICDYNMPVMRGDIFHDTLSKTPPYNKIPFIFISALADEKFILERRKKGALAYLKKPIEKHELVLSTSQILKNYIEFKQTLKFATIDELTGIRNRRNILEELDRELSRRILEPLSIIFCDIDFFKTINDTFGHQAGDAVLKKTGKLLKKLIRKADICGRYGGEKFIIVLPNTNLKQAQLAAQKIQHQLIDFKITSNEKTISFTMSFGLASLIEHAKDICKIAGIDKLDQIYQYNKLATDQKEKVHTAKKNLPSIILKLADLALYAAKSCRCKACNYKSPEKDIYNSRECPKCGSKNIEMGRNRIVSYSEKIN